MSPIFLAFLCILLQGSFAACPANENTSPFNGKCICKPGYYRNENTGICSKKQSLLLPEDYVLSLITFDPANFYDWEDDFSISFWAKATHPRDAVVIQRVSTMIVSRDHLMSSIRVGFDYPPDYHLYTTTSGTFPFNDWVHVLIVHQGSISKLRVYMGTTKVIDEQIYGTVQSVPHPSNNLNFGPNIGIVTELYFFSYADIQDFEVPLYVYQ